MTDLEEHLNKLENGSVCRFSDWPNLEVPAVAAGVYTG